MNGKAKCCCIEKARNSVLRASRGKKWNHSLGESGIAAIIVPSTNVNVAAKKT